MLFDDDEPLGRAAGLAGVVHPSPDRPLDGVVEIGVFEHDEGVAAAELHRRRLEVLARRAPRCSGPAATLPVSATPLMRGSSTTWSDCSCEISRLV